MCAIKPKPLVPGYKTKWPDMLEHDAYTIRNIGFFNFICFLFLKIGNSSNKDRVADNYNKCCLYDTDLMQLPEPPPVRLVRC